jgi:hypothetical protein
MTRQRLVVIPVVAAILLLTACGMPGPAPVPSDPSQAGPTTPDAATPDAASTDPAGPEATPGSWTVTGDAALSAAGAEVAVYECAEAGEADLARQVWGVGPYTGDSSVCVAAVHAGVITRDGGTVEVTGEPGRDSYEGSTSNGVTTSEWGSWGTSFTVAAP